MRPDRRPYTHFADFADANQYYAFALRLVRYIPGGEA